jgi:hypothetical protein
MKHDRASTVFERNRPKDRKRHVVHHAKEEKASQGKPGARERASQRGDHATRQKFEPTENVTQKMEA